ncbi:carboxymuconolactone decarboxylase family protein [Nocardia stercoris]|uniref:Carboxymuconolactone decarboxylase family protein n=1 Tax=Nocardia stercoris TaxID=2483361 RepID=A0A3M2LCR9_9NOCA|nr:carboxymuconolactone decarboxylase family protein [Nocardia stercoris]RMI35339.1 carboxymuconolactone decarboxylase family protein [Nocardia stercoris]
MNERYLRGAARQQEMGGATAARHRVYDALADIAPDLHRFAVEFAYGDIHARPGLDIGARELVIIGVLIGLGDARPQLEAHLTTALNVGVAAEAVVEAVIQALPYAGFPRVLNAMTVARTVFAERDLLPLS